MKICDICFKKGSINDKVVVTKIRTKEEPPFILKKWRFFRMNIDLCSECNDKGDEE